MIFFIINSSWIGDHINKIFHKKAVKCLCYVFMQILIIIRRPTSLKFYKQIGTRVLNFDILVRQLQDCIWYVIISSMWKNTFIQMKLAGCLNFQKSPLKLCCTFLNQEWRNLDQTISKFSSFSTFDTLIMVPSCHFVFTNNWTKATTLESVCNYRILKYKINKNKYK